MWYDIYVTTKERTKSVVDIFLNSYVNLSVESIRKDFEIRLLNKNEFIEIGTLQASIELGLADDKTTFTLYLTSNTKEIKSAIVHFGNNELLILGVSIETGTDGAFNKAKAERLLAQLKEKFNTTAGIIEVEVAPFELEDELAEIINNKQP